MKLFSKVSVFILAIAFIFNFTELNIAKAAATAVDLGAASTFSVLAGLSMSSTASNTGLWGDLGLSPGFAVSRTGDWTVGGNEYFGDTLAPDNLISSNAQADALNAFNDLAGQVSDGTWGASPWSPAPGVWTDASSPAFTGTIYLNGDYDDVWVFQVATDFTFSGSVVMQGNAQECNVFWQVVRDVTIASDSTFIGTLIAGRSVSFESGATVNGRILADVDGSVTFSGTATTILEPTCEVAPLPAPLSGGRGALLNPSLPVPPLIDVVKIPNPLALPTGPGLVTYTYTLKNIGIVPVNNIEMVDDTCNSMAFISGDIDNDTKLDEDETWVYRCSDTLTKTTTNTATASGWANDIKATDTTSATVVVGVPVVPPLIHVTKVPNPLALIGGGAVTYTYTVTNPGTVPLSDVNITDDKCTGLPGRVLGHPGDLNKNNLLENNEVWFFTCKTNITKTTTNTATASGTANDITAKDYAFATVVVSIPSLPNTGFPPEEIITHWYTLIFSKIFNIFFH